MCCSVRSNVCRSVLKCVAPGRPDLLLKSPNQTVLPFKREILSDKDPEQRKVGVFYELLQCVV